MKNEQTRHVLRSTLFKTNLHSSITGFVFIFPWKAPWFLSIVKLVPLVNDCTSRLRQAECACLNTSHDNYGLSHLCLETFKLDLLMKGTQARM